MYDSGKKTAELRGEESAEQPVSPPPSPCEVYGCEIKVFFDHITGAFDQVVNAHLCAFLASTPLCAIIYPFLSAIGQSLCCVTHSQLYLKMRRSVWTMANREPVATQIS